MVSSQIEEQFGCLSRNDCVFARRMEIGATKVGLRHETRVDRSAEKRRCSTERRNSFAKNGYVCESLKLPTEWWHSQQASDPIVLSTTPNFILSLPIYTDVFISLVSKGMLHINPKVQESQVRICAPNHCPRKGVPKLFLG